MPRIQQRRIPTNATVKSLAWAGDSLTDLLAGGVTYELDGSSTDGRVHWGFDFDGVVTAPRSGFVVLYARLGTKALLLKDGSLVRELNRRSYHADAYLYPVCLVDRGDRTLLIHCPDEYDQLQIEDAQTGERLTSRKSKPDDFFHSRLMVNPSGTRLLSAGWAWHPWSAVVYFDIDEALRNPAHLDAVGWCAPTSRHVGLAEDSSACWQTDTRSIVSGSDEPEDPREVAEAGEELILRPRGLVVYDTNARAIVSSVVLPQLAGELMPVGETHVVTFYQHPRLIRLRDGVVEHEWPDLPSGTQDSSIVRGMTPPPPMALDPANRRFAIAQENAIHVIAFD